MSQPTFAVRRFLSLAAALFAVGVGYGVVLPLVPALLEALMPAASREAVARHTGALAAIYMVAIVALAPAWGSFSDRRGRRGILLIGMAGYTLSAAAFAWTQTMVQAYALRFAAGAFAAAVVPTVFAAASELENVEQRTSWLAWLGAASLLGYLAGPAISGAIDAFLRAGVQWPLYAAAGVALLAFLFVYAGFRESATNSPETRGSPIFRTYSLARVAALSLGAMFGLGAFEVGLTVLASQRLSLGAGVLAMLFLECSLTMLIVQGWLALVPVAASRRSVTIVAASFVAVAAGFGVLASAASRPLLYVAVGLIAAGSGALLPVLTLLASLPGNIGLGAAIGIQTAAANFGQAAGSAAAGWLYGSMNRESFWLYAALMALGAGMAARR